MAEGKATLNLDSRFQFACHPGLSCFTHCCRDVNIYLSPFDVLRMRKRLGLSSREFLERYTVTLVGEGTGLPVVVLKMDEERDKRCPFVTKEGCQIYADRPWACRMFPLDKHSEYEFGLLTDASRCRGLAEPRELSVEDYLKEQGVLVYEEVEATFKLISNSPRVLAQKILNPRIIEMFYMACYDLDRFRRFVFESKFLDIFEIEPAEVERIKTDDLELLQLGFRWLQFGLVIGDALKIKDKVLEEAKKKQQAARGEGR